MKMINYLHFIFLVMIFLIMSSCSNKIGTTNSKIRILSGNLLGLLSDQANNGLVLYGTNNKGKTFLKKISGDIVDLNLPNGVWNFYAIGWGLSTDVTDSGFTGTTICAKNLAVKLSGADVALSMTLSNANCDTDFHPDVDTIGSEKKLSSFTINSCKDFTTVTDASTGEAACSFTKANKGFATYVKIVMPEYAHLGLVTDGFIGPAIESKCIKIESALPSSGASSADIDNINKLNLPLPGINGMALGVKAYYSSAGCIEASTPSLFNWEEGMISPKIKRFSSHTTGTQAIDHYFIKTEADDVCQPPRLSNLDFASGIGTPYLPYTICNPEQLILMQTKFPTTSDKHFELLRNLDFGFKEFLPIGEDTYTKPNSLATPNPFTGSFNGNGHRIENMRISCKSIFDSTITLADSVGLFRFTQNASIQNLTINKIAIDCASEGNTQPEVNNVGMIVGKSVDTTFSNLKAFGFVSGSQFVGGIAGEFSGTNAGEMNDVHVEATIQGKRYIGGILGRGVSIASTPNKTVFRKSSFKGDLHARLQSVNKGICTNLTVPGILGDYCTIGTTIITTPNGIAFTVSSGTPVLIPSGASVMTYDNVYYDPITNNWRKLSSGNTNYSQQIPYDTFIGGLAGELTSTSTNRARVSEIKIDLNSIEGSRLIGGLVGKSDYIDIENSYVTGLVKSYSQLDGISYGTGYSKIGGLIGSAAYGTFKNNLILVEKKVETDINKDTYLKAVIGEERSAPICTDNLFTGAGVSGSLCSANAGILNDLVNPASYPPTFDYTSATPIWSWPIGDRSYDFPRLNWELSKENEIPYLKRLCSNLYVTPTGTGFTATDPQSICSWNQLLGMIPGKYYELKKNLIDDGINPIHPIVPGVYHLNGNNFSLSNFSINAILSNNALFESLEAGSEISNLKIKLAKVSNTVTKPLGTDYNVALLAANNSGTIKNVETSNSRIYLNSLSLTGSTNASIAGLVAKNFAPGVISNVDNDVDVILDLPTVSTTSSLKAAGLVASNNGTLSIIRQNGMVSRRIGNYGGETQSLNSTTCLITDAGHYVYNNAIGASPLASGYYRCIGLTWINVSASLMNSTEEIGGLVAINHGLIQEVEQQNSVQIMDSNLNYNGKLSPFISTTGPNSQLKDISFRGNLNSNRGNISSFFNSFQGSINRMIVNLGGISGAAFTAINSIIPYSYANNVSEMICVQGSSMPDCQTGKMTYEYTATGLSFYNNGTAIPGFSYLTDWNIGSAFLPDMTKTWKLENNNPYNPPSLMRTGGSFEKIGAGF